MSFKSYSQWNPAQIYKMIHGKIPALYSIYIKFHTTQKKSTPKSVNGMTYNFLYDGMGRK